MLKTIRVLIAVMSLVAGTTVLAQPARKITDTQPVTVDGLEMGYTIKSEEVKKVSDKGDFSRYSVKFYVTNTSSQAKILLYKQGWNVMGNVTDKLAQFICLNATGARFTSKTAIISADACNVIANVEDKDCATGKTAQNKRFVQIGYWIKAGQTISTSAIMIVPLNEPLNMEVEYLGNTLQPPASADMGLNPYTNQPARPIYNYTQGFSKIRNIQNNTYLNNQQGPVTSSIIDAGWWSAQWELIPVPNTNYFNIKNRWKGSYLSTDTGGVGLFVNYMSDGARWVLEPSRDGNVFRIRNVDSGGYLCFASNQVKLAINYNNVATSEWIFEQP